MTATFITATGTDIGKTYLAAGLIARCRSAGRGIDALKPVVTGFDASAAASSDPGVLLTALGRSLGAVELDRFSPWRFVAPLSPDMAAQKEGKSIDFDQLVAFCRRAIAQAAGTLLIEGIGGVMVPLDDRKLPRQPEPHPDCVRCAEPSWPCDQGARRQRNARSDGAYP
jgi:dethiobiotin synthetase